MANLLIKNDEPGDIYCHDCSFETKEIPCVLFGDSRSSGIRSRACLRAQRIAEAMAAVVAAAEEWYRDMNKQTLMAFESALAALKKEEEEK